MSIPTGKMSSDYSKWTCVSWLQHLRHNDRLDSLPTEQTITLKHRWLGKNEAPNMVYTLKFNLKIAADGSLTSRENE